MTGIGKTANEKKSKVIQFNSSFIYNMGIARITQIVLLLDL
jgi:hypothetical protein